MRGEITMKTVPKHIRAKIERMGRLMDALVDLNIEVEQWVEKNTGISSAFDLAEDNRDDRGYAYWLDSRFIEDVERLLNEGTVER
jgi:hypothetical protein